MEYDNTIKRINETYQLNIKEIEKTLLNVGINIRKNKDEYKLLPQVLEELSLQWEALFTEENKFIKKWICKVIAGIRDTNFLKRLIDNLHKKRQ